MQINSIKEKDLLVIEFGYDSALSGDFLEDTNLCRKDLYNKSYSCTPSQAGLKMLSKSNFKLNSSKGLSR